MHTRYWEAGARGGQQKADHRGCRKQTRFLELGGGVGGAKKGNQSSNWGSRCQKWGYLGNQGKPRKTRQG